VVQHAWEAAVSATSGGVLSKLEHMHGALHRWDHNVLKQPKKRLQKAQEKFERAMTGPMNDESEVIANEMVDLIELLLEHRKRSIGHSDQERICCNMETKIP
jgi:hypothetical protein